MVTTRAMWMCLVIVALAVPAAAGPGAVEAEQLFRDGRKLMDEKKYAEACEAFEASQKLDPAINTLVNLADCREKNRQFATAWSLFLEVERGTRDDKKRAALHKTAGKRARALEANLSYLTISVPDESRIDGLVIKRNGAELEAALWNRAIPVDGGEYVISGQAPGHEVWETKVFISAEAGRTTVDVPKFKEAAKLVVKEPAPPPAGPEGEGEEAQPPRPSSPGMFTSERRLAVGVAIVGLAAVGGAFALGSSAGTLEDQARALCTADPCPAAAEANAILTRAHSRATQANIVLGVGAAAVVGAVVLWFTGGPSSPDEGAVSLSPRLSPTHAGLDLAVRF